MKIIYKIILFGSIVLLSCNKEEFLEAKPDQALIVPQTIDEIQAIIDNTSFFNGMSTLGGGGGSGIVTVLGQTASDDYFYGRPNLYESMPLFIKNTYTWKKEDPFAGSGMVSDWSLTYQAVFYANTSLFQLEKLSVNEQQSQQGKMIKGSALFHRAHLYYQLAQVFAPVYQKELATDLHGLPLRLQADVNEKVYRNTLKETYSQILEDLHNSLDYLPLEAPYTTRPTLTAAYALLARVYLSMSDYPNALVYADMALEIQKGLLDYNTLDSLSDFPIPKDNQEVIFSCLMSLGGGTIMAVGSSFASVDSNLYKSYLEGDLRKVMFFTPRTESQSQGMKFKGSYFGSVSTFAGLATDELYLIKAECLARAGKTEQACLALNTLLVNRFEPDKFQPIAINDEGQLLRVVLDERRKELLFRVLRWTDLRRLNLEPRFAITLKRNIAGGSFELPPNDPRYTYPIPSDVIGFHPEMPQNLR